MSDDKKHSYIKFYGRDWLGDTMLRMCSPEERGVWIDLLCVMAGAEPYGHLAVNNRMMTDSEVSRVIGMDENTYKGILYRLLEKGIPSKAENGMIYSRRMVKEHKKFITGRVSGLKGGGNPALKINTENHNPDTISQIPNTKGGLKVPFIGRVDPNFEIFWESYPRKTAKKAALKEWESVKQKPPITDILQAIESQKKSDQWRKDSGQFIPHPATWINQGRWDDKPFTIIKDVVKTRVKLLDEYITDACLELDQFETGSDGWNAVITRWSRDVKLPECMGTKAIDEAQLILHRKRDKQK